MRRIMRCVIIMLTAVSPCFGAVIHVPADAPTIQAGIDAAVDGDTVLVADGIYTGQGNANIDPRGKTITIMSENGSAHCTIDCAGLSRGFNVHSFETWNTVIRGFTVMNGNRANAGGGLYIDDAVPTIDDCLFMGNHATYGGGIYVRKSHYPGIEGVPLIINTRVVKNTAEEGGGVCFQNRGGYLYNCVINGNRAVEGAGIDIWSVSVVKLLNCTVLNNVADDTGGAFCIRQTSYPNVDVTNSIIWNNLPDNLYGSAMIQFSCISGGYPGLGNIAADPIFVTGPLGNVYLSQIRAGQSLDSPCLDKGYALAGDTCFFSPDGECCMSDFTTSTNSQPDTDMADMGYHYSMYESPPEIDLGVVLDLPRYVSPGDPFWVTGKLVNTGDTLRDIPVVFALQVYDAFWFWPDWQSGPPIHYRIMDVPTGKTIAQIIPETVWPDTKQSSMNDLWWYGCLLIPDLSNVLGEMAVVQWGYGP
jgi:predicted outer membrane repeat protein